MASGSAESLELLEERRREVRALLSVTAPADALYAYFALYHDPRRTRLYVYENANGEADGFVAVCQTGRRLFQPTVALRTPSAEAAVELLRQGLAPGRPYYVTTTLDLRDAVAEVVHIEQPAINRIYRLELFRFQPGVNVLVEAEHGLGGRPRFVIRSHGEIAAEAGVNWHSPHFVALYVRAAPRAQERGWGQAVVAACTRWVLGSARQPLYIVNEGNEASIGLAEAVGYVDTGARELASEGVCRP